PEQDRRLPSLTRFMGIPTCAIAPRPANAWLAGLCAAAFLALAPGQAAAQGRIVNGALVPTSYIATISSKKSETIKINLANGGVKDFSIEPEPPVDADRIVVTEAHKKGVV